MRSHLLHFDLFPRWMRFTLAIAPLSLSWLGITISNSQAIAPMDEQIAQQPSIQEFYEFFDSPEIQEAIAQLDQNSEMFQLDALPQIQDTLQQLDQNAVVFYPLVLEDRLELILLTADAPPLQYTVPVSRTDLNQAVSEFRQSLTRPSSDLKPIAQQLYEWLIEPLEDDLQATDIETILYAPDGVLRYVPLAAFHTGEQWLVEKYTINHITGASLLDLSRFPQQPPRVLAAAHTEGTLEVLMGDRTMQLSGFLFAQEEVETIAQLIPDTTVLLNAEFSPENLLPQLNDHTIVHLAANTHLDPTSLTESFILFGNGDRLSLAEVQNWSMSNVDLFVLSACETGVGNSLGEGQEILSLSYLFQNAGVGSVVAPLWQVDDFATKELMVAFYQAIAEGRSYAEALRQAQLDLIASESMPEVRQLKGALEIVPAAPLGMTQSRLSHPYYWAPFVVFGNGL